jgi:polyphosphate kinase
MAAVCSLLEATDTAVAPWHVVPADDRRRARLNLIRHMLSSIPYHQVPVDLPKVPKAEPRPKGASRRAYGAGRLCLIWTNGRAGLPSLTRRRAGHD